jgi:hypothetical protein
VLLALPPQPESATTPARLKKGIMNITNTNILPRMIVLSRVASRITTTGQFILGLRLYLLRRASAIFSGA